MRLRVKPIFAVRNPVFGKRLSRNDVSYLFADVYIVRLKIKPAKMVYMISTLPTATVGYKRGVEKVFQLCNISKYK